MVNVEWIARGLGRRNCAFSSWIWGAILNLIVKNSVAFQLRISYICCNNASPKDSYTLQTNVGVLKRSFVWTERSWLNESNNRLTFGRKWCGNLMMLTRVGIWQILMPERQRSIMDRNRMGRQKNCQKNCHSTELNIISYPSFITNRCVQNIYWHMTERAEFMLSTIMWRLLLTPAHNQFRLKWCCAWLARNCTDLRRIVFRDESAFQLCLVDDRKRVLRRQGKKKGRTCPDIIE